MGELDYEEAHGFSGCNVAGGQCGRLWNMPGLALESRDELRPVPPGRDLHGSLFHDMRGAGQLL
jgi:hypothetical protein